MTSSQVNPFFLCRHHFGLASSHICLHIWKQVFTICHIITITFAGLSFDAVHVLCGCQGCFELSNGRLMERKICEWGWIVILALVCVESIRLLGCGYSACLVEVDYGNEIKSSALSSWSRFRMYYSMNAEEFLKDHHLFNVIT